MDSTTNSKIERGLAKYREGLVTSNKMLKTVVVSSTGMKKHPKYAKFVLETKKFVAHDESGECKVGDKVRLIESRPLSKTKRWRVTEILEKAL